MVSSPVSPPRVAQITQDGIHGADWIKSVHVRKKIAAIAAATLVSPALVSPALVSPAVAGAAPKNYCADIKGTDNGKTCQIQITDPGYTVTIGFPSNYPDMKSVTEFVSKTRDQFLNTAKSSTPRDSPYSLEITATNYNSFVPPRGQQSLVLKVYQNTGGPHPQTSFKSFVWDQAYRKPVTYETLWQPDKDPLPVVFPAVRADVDKQAGKPVPIAPEAGLDPANYQNFAITNEGVIFFFSQGTLLPEAAGAMQVLVPRSVIDPLLA